MVSIGIFTGITMADMVLNSKKCGKAAAKILVIYSLLSGLVRGLLLSHQYAAMLRQGSIINWFLEMGYGYQLLIILIFVVPFILFILLVTAFIDYALGYSFAYFYNKS